MKNIGLTLIELQGKASIFSRCKIDCGDGINQIQIWRLSDNSNIVIQAEFIRAQGELRTVFRHVTKNFLLYRTVVRQFKKQILREKNNRGRMICHPPR